EMIPGQAYKLDAEMEGTIFVDFFTNDYSPLYENVDFDQNINPRWNWVGYPYEYEYLLSRTYDATALAEGDMVITKDGDMAIIKDGEWTGDFFVKPNTGMMLYHNGEAETSLPMKARGDIVQGYWEGNAIPRTKEREISVWHYDGSRFANMMAVVGQLNIDNADDYTIGAFVGDECRGAGKIIDGLVLVSLAGEAGEEVTFRIHNEWTGEFFELKNVLGFTDIAGSLKNPVMLDVPEEVTAIESVSTSGINFSGNVLNLGEYTGVATVTTVDGKVVAKTTESSIAVDNLPAGIYVVSINGGSKPIVKKIVKE
ncbi:MAG: T9SS type A sorting domain-containing protein, partial [Bacteroidaceae bacterium]|nr:T9SS type A sorting domain-containing protein [Bacteroidaceae bacterium]